MLTNDIQLHAAALPKQHHVCQRLPRLDGLSIGCRHQLLYSKGHETEKKHMWRVLLSIYLLWKDERQQSIFSPRYPNMANVMCPDGGDLEDKM